MLRVFVCCVFSDMFLFQGITRAREPESGSGWFADSSSSTFAGTGDFRSLTSRLSQKIRGLFLLNHAGTVSLTIIIRGKTLNKIEEAEMASQAVHRTGLTRR